MGMMNNNNNSKVRMVFPEKKSLPLEGLYLKHNLQELASRMNSPLVIANYVTDVNGVIAKRDENGRFQVPKEIKNSHDWRLFQELEAQADVIITATGYLNRFKREGDDAQNVFSQFEKGNSFEKLGTWRLNNSFEKRHPDIAVVSRSLDFEVPKYLLIDRKISVFTTFKGFESKKGKELQKQGVHLVASGKDGVDGNVMINHLAGELNYNVIHMVTGPSILKILLNANKLSRLYLTQVQKELSNNNSDTLKILNGQDITSLPDFKLVEKYIEENITANDGGNINQHFLVYNHMSIK
jgi:riboflavin biosynthesis pyrimidine reductase